MAQIVKLRRSSISGQKPTNSHLQLGEIALNTTDGKAFLAVSGSLGESVQEFITTNASNTGSIYLSGSIKLQGDESISGSLLMTGSIINVDSISYNTGSNSNLYPGVRRWNSDAGTTELRLSGNNVTLQDGQEILYRVYNSTLSPITDGTPVTVIGSYQGHDSVEPAFAGGGDNTKYRVIGVATETINPAEFGFITRIGIVHDLNLSGFTLGEEVYLSQTEYGKLAHKEDLSISGRTIELGVVLDNSSTTGSLRLQIFNESGIQQNTSAEINTFTVNDTSTGIFNFGGITVATPTTFNVGTINGWIVDNATDPLKPYSKYVEYSGSNGLTTEYLTTSIATYLLLNESGSIVSQSNFPTSENRRRMIYLGKLIHSDKTTIRLAENTPDIMYSPLSQLREFLSPIRLINNGVSPTPDGANLSFSISGGYLHGFGVNYINDHYNPNVLYIPPQAVTTFQYRTQNGGTYTDVTTISPRYYDNNGVRTLIAGDPKQSTNQRIFLTSAGGILVQYGQTVYSKIEDAIAGIPSENFVTFPPIKENAILIGIVSLSIGATNLNNVTKAKFTLVGKFGETIGGTGGSISASDITLQNAYDNSTDPEIITNAILDGVTIKRGSSSDTDNLIVFKNGNDEIKSYVKATGDSLFNNSIFSGSIHVLGKITGSANFATLDNLPTLVSGSGQISFTGITDKPTLVSGSSQVSFTGLTDKPTLVSGSSQVSFTGLSSIPAGIVSGSSQVSYTGLSNIPVGIISGAAQLPAGTVSGSSQVSFNGITDKPTLVSGSGQISFNGITDKPTLVSGSSQVSYTGLSNIPVGIISGAAQLPAGTVSGSSQVSFTGITDKPTLVSGSSQVSYTGLSSIPAGIVSGAVQVKSLLPAGTVSGSSQVSFTGITDKPTLVSGSVQVDITQTTGYSAFSSSISSSIGGLSSSIASTDSTQNGRLSSIEGKTGSISDLNTYTGSNNTVIGTLQTATSSLNSFTSSIHGAIEVTGSNLTVKGDFLVKGTTTIIDSTTLDIKDNIIQLNGTGATNGGLVVRDATAPNTVSGSLLWDTTNDKWIAGQVGFEDEIVLLTKTQALTNKTINATLNTLSNIPNTSLTNSSITIAGNSISLGGTITSATILSSTGVWSGSAQLPAGIVSGAAQLPVGLVSGSSQVSYSGLSGVPAGIVSGAAQVKTLLPGGSVSGSSQISFTGITDKPALVSGSSQVTYSGLSGVPAGLVSGSSQVTYSGLSGVPSGIVSGAAQLPAGLVSGSSQISFTGITDKPTLVSGSSQITYSGLSGIPSTFAPSAHNHSWANITSGIPAGLVSGSSQVSYSGLSGVPEGIVSGAAQLPTGIVSGSSQVTYSGLSGVPAGIVSGAAQLPAGLVSGSSQVSYSGLSGIPSTFAPSAHNHSWANITSGIPAGLVSGSSQVSYSGLSGIPTGIVSGAAQLPSGTVSGSSQISFTGITDKPTLVSGSSQISYTGLSNIPTGIISGASQLPSGTVSGSSQISYTGLSNIPSGIVSGAAQVKSLLPAGTVSGSSQVSYTGLSNIPSGIISGAAQLPSGTVSGSSQISFTGITDKPSLVSGSSQVSYTGLSNIPSGIISGSVQVDITQTTGYSTFSSSISSSIGGLSSSIASTDSTQNGRLSSIEGKTGSISDLNTYTGSNNTVIGSLQTATSSLNSFTSSIQGAIEVTGSNLTVKGDFLVKGTTTIIDSTTLDIKDNIIQLNGTGATNGGLVVRDATAPNTVSGSLLWDTTNDKWIAGQVGFEQPIVLSTTFNSYGDSRYLQVTGGTLNGALTIVGALSGVTTLSASDNITTSGRLLAGNATDGVAIYRNDTYGDIIGINTSLSEYNDLRLRASLSDQMFLRTNGNVDIGYSTAQGSKFAVNGSGFFNGNVSISSTGNLLFVVQGNETGSGIYWKKDQSPFVSSAAIVPFYDGQSYNRKGIGFYTGDFEDFTTESVLRMVILRNGNVGIGYTNRTEKFAVNGSGYFNGNLQINGALSGATTGKFSGRVRFDGANTSEIGTEWFNEGVGKWLIYRVGASNDLGIFNWQGFDAVRFAYSTGAATFASSVSAASFTSGGNVVLHAGNYSSYALPLSGGTLSNTSSNSALSLYTGSANSDNFINFLNDGQSVKLGVRNPYSLYGLTFVTPSNEYYRIIHEGNIGSQSVTYSINSSKLYSTDVTYSYGGAAPYYGYLTYNGGSNRWRFKVSPATPDQVEVAYADNAGNSSTTSQTSFSTLTVTGNLTFSTISTANANTASIQGNWSGAGYWALGSDGAHTLKFDQINALGGTQSFAGATDITLKLGTKTVLDSGNYNSYSPTLTGGNASGTWGIHITGNSTAVNTSIGAGSEANLVYTLMADNDYFRIRAGGSSNSGWAEIATADDGNEPIYVRQYSGVFSSVVRTLSLLDGSGNTTFPGIITENSSLRYKKDITTITNALDIVNSMRGVKYIKLDNNVSEIGVIAEEISEILPEVVIYDSENRPDSVSYGRITAVLIEAIKELKQQVEDLRKNG